MSGGETSIVNPIFAVRSLSLKLRLQRLANLEQRTLSQMARIILSKYMNEEEKSRGLCAIEQDPEYQNPCEPAVKFPCQRQPAREK